jgi:hypothetical protein
MGNFKSPIRNMASATVKIALVAYFASKMLIGDGYAQQPKKNSPAKKPDKHQTEISREEALDKRCKALLEMAEKGTPSFAYLKSEYPKEYALAKAQMDTSKSELAKLDEVLSGDISEKKDVSDMNKKYKSMGITTEIRTGLDTAEVRQVLDGIESNMKALFKYSDEVASSLYLSNKPVEFGKRAEKIAELFNARKATKEQTISSMNALKAEIDKYFGELGAHVSKYGNFEGSGDLKNDAIKVKAFADKVILQLSK